eukprot:gene6450-4649_t
MPSPPPKPHAKRNAQFPSRKFFEGLVGELNEGGRGGEFRGVGSGMRGGAKTRASDQKWM